MIRTGIDWCDASIGFYWNSPVRWSLIRAVLAFTALGFMGGYGIGQLLVSLCP